MGLDLSHFNLMNFVMVMSLLLLAITFHEFAHAFAADRLGDPTPRQQGRLSLFPQDHLDPVGTLMMAITSIVGVGIGWGKPVMVNPRNFRNPTRDNAIVSAAGPISNLIQAVVLSGILRLVMRSEAVGEQWIEFLVLGILVNLGLALFNLIPIAPLDGSWILMAILPPATAARYRSWMMAYGSMLFLGIVLLAPKVLWIIIGPPRDFLAKLLVPGL